MSETSDFLFTASKEVNEDNCVLSDGDMAMIADAFSAQVMLHNKNERASVLSKLTQISDKIYNLNDMAKEKK